MIVLFFYYLAGLIIEQLTEATKQQKFTYSIPTLALRVALGLLFSFALSKADLNYWFVGLILVCIGFLSFHVEKFLIKKKS